MARIKATDTGPELRVRRLLHGLGYRYRLHVKNLPGRPDLVFPNRRKIIFVHGCYWHRHVCPRGRSMPSTRSDFWNLKFDANRQGDRDQLRRLREQGWDVLVIWECQTLDLAELRRRCITYLDPALA